MERIDDILNFWFGRVEQTIVPSENRARIWFGDDSKTDAEIISLFGDDLEKAIRGEYNSWGKSGRGQLALILLFDQFSRHVYRDTLEAFTQDIKALDICVNGIQNEMEHSLSLIERVFYYFPLLHSEELIHQEKSVRAYQMLSELAFTETRVIYDSFLKFANHHFSIIQRFKRFPQRNIVLGRESTEDERIYLKETEGY